MKTRRSIKCWKVVLLGAISLLFLYMLVEIIPVVYEAYADFAREYRHAGLSRVDLYSERASLYHIYLCMILFIASCAALALYGFFRCFCPAKTSSEDTDERMSRWRRVTYICLAVFAICIVLLLWYCRTHGDYDAGIANGGEWTTAADLIIPGRLGIALILSMDGVAFSLIRRRELKRAGTV